jgi:outer membrane protein OmpA-like peptidoglycan-associated protein
MKKHASLIGILLLFFFSTKAQLPILFKDEFTNNSNGWGIGSSSDYSAKIEGGRFVLTTLEEDNGRYFTVSPFMDHSKDFSLEASFLQKSGMTDNGLGLLWGLGDDQYNAFKISISGDYRINSPEKRKGLNEWIKYKKIKPLGEVNQLRIESRNEKIYYYINGEQVATTKTLPLYGNGLGFVNNTQMVLEIDDLVFRQDLKINLPATQVVNIEKENLGTQVNSIYDEVTPRISANGNSLFFSRKSSVDNIGGVEDQEDVWYSTLQNGTWGKSMNVGAPINSATIDNLISLSTDENTMIFAISEGFGIRERRGESWSEKENIGIKYVNEDKFLEGCLSSDGKAMLFTIMTKDNVSYNSKKIERDVYVALKDKKGKWSSPINLGKSVNTSEDEYSPFLSSDGKTLYFASRGWPGYGSTDIFMTKRLDNSWKKWSEPINLGPQINTISFDAYYSIPASGEYAYMCSSLNSVGLTDIVRIKLPQSIRPEPVVLISGRTLNAKTKKPISTDIKFDNLALGQEVGEAISNPSSGSFSLVLPYGFNYGLHAAAKGFLSVNENLELVNVGTYTEIQKDLYLVPIEVGESIQLQNVFFEQGKPILKSESFPELDRLAEILKDNPSIHIELAGHTDNVGSPNLLLVLSQNRVITVKKYLEDKGIASKRVEGKGYGSTQPIEKNDTEEHRKMNRRVEFRITKK